MLLKPKNKQTYPYSAEREYFRVLRAVQRELDKSVRSVDGIRLDSTRREQMVEMVKEIFRKSRTNEKALKEIRRIFKDIDALARRNLEQAIAECLNETPIIEPDVITEEYPEEWHYTQKVLLEDVENNYFTKLALALAVMTVGEGIAEAYSAMERTTENRLKKIAVNEVGNVFSVLTRKYQLAAGIEFYAWETKKDERVRKSHRARDGKFYFWEKTEGELVEGLEVNPRPDKHPGEDWGCRCIAVPIVPFKQAKVHTSVPNQSRKLT